MDQRLKFLRSWGACAVRSGCILVLELAGTFWEAQSSGFAVCSRCRSVDALSYTPSVAVVIPCFNEGRSIAALVKAVHPVLPDVFVIDDGSGDDTALAAKSAGARLIRHAANLGKGAALKDGLRQAWVEEFKFAVTMDGDGQHDPADLPAFLAAAAADDADLVIGNRMLGVRSMPWLRRQVNRWMSRRISRRAGTELPDTQCGYRLIRLAAWHELELTTSRFEVESEMVLAFLAAGRRVRFVPVRTIYKTEQSKIHPIRDTVRWFRWWRRKG